MVPRASPAGGCGSHGNGGDAHGAAGSPACLYRPADPVIRECDRLPFGATDCAQPILWALHNKIEADVFVVYTDCETWAGSVSPSAVLKQYRAATGIDARLIVVAMTTGGFSLADPADAGMIYVVGFDAGAPEMVRQFVNGNV